MEKIVLSVDCGYVNFAFAVLHNYKLLNYDNCTISEKKCSSKNFFDNCIRNITKIFDEEIKKYKINCILVESEPSKNKKCLLVQNIVECFAFYKGIEFVAVNPKLKNQKSFFRNESKKSYYINKRKATFDAKILYNLNISGKADDISDAIMEYIGYNQKNNDIMPILNDCKTCSEEIIVEFPTKCNKAECDILFQQLNHLNICCKLSIMNN